MDKNVLKKKLENKKIILTKHFLEKASVRGIDPNYVENLLKTLEKFVTAIVQEEKENEIKLELLFEKSRKYDLRAIISIKEKKKCINIITAHIQNIFKIRKEERG